MKRRLLFSFIGVSILSVFVLLVIQSNKQRDNSSKKQQWAELIANHVYSKRPHLSADELKSIPKADRPDLAMEQDVLMTMDPALGLVPTERKILANKRVQQILSTKGPISGVEWQERGPNNVGGRTRALMFDPNDVSNKKVWAAGVGGGLWYTNDITADPPTWNLVDDVWKNIAVTCIAYNPANTQELYVGTGEGFFNADAQMGAGIWKSSNGGSTWAQLINTDPGAYNSASHFHYVNKIVVKADGTVFAATRGYYINTGGVMRSTNNGTDWTNVLSIYQVSTTYYDRGADIEIAANGDLYASIGLFSSGQVYKSINADNGASATWTNISSNIVMDDAERIELACAPSDANVVYAVADGGNGSIDVKWVKKSIDGGDNWTTISTPVMVDGTGDHFTRGQAFYDLILAVHPSNSSLVLVGGIDLHRTTNGGTSWSPISHWYGGFSKPEVHADQHAIQFRPGSSNEVIFGNDGGVYYSTNAGNSAATPSFASKNDGYNVTQFYSCATKNEVNSNYFLAGAQDNGSQQFSSPQIGSTVEVSGGDGAFCHIDQLNPNIQTTAYTYNNIYRSTNGGASFTKDIIESSGHFINPSDYDSQRKILYLAADDDKVKRLSDFDATISNSDISISVGTAKVSALKVSPFNDVLFLGIENGRIYKMTTASGSPSLSRIDNGTTSITNAGWVSSIDIGANDNTIMVTYSNYGVTSIWETTDGGTNWYSKEGDLEDIPVRWALYNPENRDEVLIATEVGVWSTDNFGTGTSSSPNWGVSSTGLAYTRCTMLKYRAADKMVVVSTHGRGLFTSDIFVSVPVVDFNVDNNISCSGSLTVLFTDGSLSPGDSWAWDIDNDGTTDYTTQNPSHTYSDPGVYSVKLKINGGAQEITKENLIIVLSGEPAENDGCSLATSNTGNVWGIGIYNFELGSIANSTSHNDAYYNNYSCSVGTALALNTSYNITIQTGIANNEGASVYIDYNGDGDFNDPNELVATFTANKLGSRTSSFTTLASGISMNEGLRLRVISKFSSIPSSACDNSDGQVEDYTVYFKEAEPTWTGAVGSSWSATGNWSGGVVPTSSDNAIITTAGTAPVIGNGIEADCNNLTINSGATLTLATGGSLITAGAIANSGTFNAQATMSNGEWHYISSPISNAQSGLFAGDYIQTWDETNALWSDVAELNMVLTPARGYGFWSADGNTTYTFSGTPNTGNKSVGMTTTDVNSNGLSNDNDGANLLGNPYPSSIDWDGLNETYGAIHYWNGTAYVSWNGGGAGSQFVAPVQGFFVLANGVTSFSVNNNNRTHSGASGFYKSKNNVNNGLVIAASNGSYEDDLWIMFRESSTSQFDFTMDASKFYTNTPGISQLYTINTDRNLSIDVRPESEIIPLGFRNDKNGNYSIMLKDFDGIGQVEIEDTKLDVFHDLLISSYEFDWNISDSEDRFKLHLSATGLGELGLQEAQVYGLDQQVYIRMDGAFVYDQVDIFDLSGRLIGAYTLSKSETQSIALANKGIYLVKLSGASGSQTEKIIIK